MANPTWNYISRNAKPIAVAGGLAAIAAGAAFVLGSENADNVKNAVSNALSNPYLQMFASGVAGTLAGYFANKKEGSRKSVAEIVDSMIPPIDAVSLDVINRTPAEAFLVMMVAYTGTQVAGKANLPIAFGSGIGYFIGAAAQKQTAKEVT